MYAASLPDVGTPAGNAKGVLVAQAQVAAQMIDHQRSAHKDMPDGPCPICGQLARDLADHLVTTHARQWVLPT